MIHFLNVDWENLIMGNYEIHPNILKNVPFCISKIIEQQFTLGITGTQNFMN
jgi:hypothetical protein